MRKLSYNVKSIRNSAKFLITAICLTAILSSVLQSPSVKQEDTAVSQHAQSLLFEDLECAGQINLGLSVSGEAVINPNMFLIPDTINEAAFEVILIDSEGNTLPNDTLTCEHLGQIFEVKVQTLDGTNACWGYLLLEDKYKPQLTCRNDTIFCTEELPDPNAEGYYTVIDNCSNEIKTLNITWNTYDEDCNEDFLGYYVREIQAVDGYFNKSNICYDTIFVQRINIDEISAPVTADVPCDSLLNYDLTEDGFPKPTIEGTGVPTINGIPIFPISKSSVCMTSISYSDRIWSKKACQRTIQRTWQIYTWDCNGGEERSLMQFINVLDTVPPVIAPLDDITAYVDHHCEYLYTLPIADISDNCGEVEDLVVTIDAQGHIPFIKNGDTSLIFGQGVHTITYKAQDAIDCDIYSEETFTLTVLDGTGPINICKEFVTVTLSGGIAELIPATIDQGTTDKCSGKDVTFKLLRMEDACGFEGGIPRDTLTFCCEDAGKVIMVAMEATDASGNKNTCMVSVTVKKDEGIPTIICPAPIEINCDAVDTITNDNIDAALGSIIVMDGCIGEVVQSLNKDSLNSCNIGEMTREIIVFDIEGDSIWSCKQIITVNPVSVFNIDSIIWPEDYVTYTGSIDNDALPLVSKAPIVSLASCQLVSLDFTDEIIPGDPGECLKIRRTWVVTDECTDQGSFTDPNPQILILIDSIDPIITSIEISTINLLDIEICLSGSSCDSTLITVNAFGTDNFTPSNDLHWTWIAEISNGPTTPTGIGSEASFYAYLGQNTISFTVTDSCENSTILFRDFTVIDCALPVAICQNAEVTIDINDDGTYGVLNAKDIDNGSNIPCSVEDLYFTLNDVKPIYSNIDNDHFFKDNGLGVGVEATEMEYIAGDAQKWDAANYCSSILLFCDDGDSKDFVLTVWDADMNSASCDATVSINNDACLLPCDCEETAFTGMAVVTCYVNPDEDELSPIGVIYNVRDNQNHIGDVWLDVPKAFEPVNWRVDSIGHVFSITMDQSNNVYLAATDIYDVNQEVLTTGGLPPAVLNEFPGRIYKASPSDGFRAVPWAIDIPNTGGRLNGIGDVVYDKNNNQFFASNLEDGKIYRLDTDGNTLETYDPFAVDNGATGIAPQDEQIWGLGIISTQIETKLFFAQITNGGSRKLFSLTLSGNAFPAAANAEIEEVANINGDRNVISDIAISQEGNLMLIAERGHEANESSDAHESKVFRYSLNGSVWQEDLTYTAGSQPGGWPEGQNSAGGVSFGFEGVTGDVPGNAMENACGIDSLIWISSNFSRNINSGNRDNDTITYGIQGVDVNGNDFANHADNDVFIDFDGIFLKRDAPEVFSAKGQIGDVEIFGCGFELQNPFVGVFGEIKTESNINVIGTEVNLLNAGNSQTLLNKTKVQNGGEYSLNDIQNGNNYEVVPYKDGDDINGVSTLDLIYIQRHILGMQKLDSPYAIIAADVNNDQKVTSSDLVQLRKLVLGRIKEFSDNTSWRFVDKNQVLNPNQPWASPLLESYYIENLSSNMEVNFMGIKIGDVNGTAFNNFSTSNKRSSNQIAVSISNREIQRGEIFEVQLALDKPTEMVGYQLSLNLNNVDFLEVVTNHNIDNQLGSEHINFIDNRINISWSNQNSVETNQLITLRLKARQSGFVSDVIGLAKDDIEPQVYDGRTLEVKGLVLRFDKDKTLIGKTLLHQNSPNPFNQSTRITYELPEAGPVTLRFIDVSGRVLKSISRRGDKGENTTIISNSELGISSGTVIYELITNDQSLYRKMILLH